MPTFRNKTSLFATGPSRIDDAGLALRHDALPASDEQGIELLPRGISPRTITQRGQLLADDLAQLREQTDAIESLLDGVPGSLIDDDQRTWPGTVMLAFEAKPVTRAGSRWSVHYTIRYQQVQP